MWGGSGSSGSSGSGGGGDVMGGVSKAWVNQNFVSIEFFGRLFETYDSATPTPTQVLPNDLESTITNIKAKFGLWTEQYISALGQGSGGGGGGASGVLRHASTWSAPYCSTASLFEVPSRIP